RRYGVIRAMRALDPAAAIDHVVGARRLDAIRRSLFDLCNSAAPERFPASNASVDQIAGSRAWNEDDHASGSAHAITAGSDRIDAELSHQRRPSARAARVHDDIAGATCPAAD